MAVGFLLPPGPAFAAASYDGHLTVSIRFNNPIPFDFPLKIRLRFFPMFDGTVMYVDQDIDREVDRCESHPCIGTYRIKEPDDGQRTPFVEYPDQWDDFSIYIYGGNAGSWEIGGLRVHYSNDGPDESLTDGTIYATHGYYIVNNYDWTNDLPCSLWKPGDPIPGNKGSTDDSHDLCVIDNRFTDPSPMTYQGQELSMASHIEEKRKLQMTWTVKQAEEARFLAVHGYNTTANVDFHSLPLLLREAAYDIGQNTGQKYYNEPKGGCSGTMNYHQMAFSEDWAADFGAATACDDYRCWVAHASVCTDYECWETEHFVYAAMVAEHRFWPEHLRTMAKYRFVLDANDERADLHSVPAMEIVDVDTDTKDIYPDIEWLEKVPQEPYEPKVGDMLWRFDKCGFSNNPSLWTPLPPPLPPPAPQPDSSLRQVGGHNFHAMTLAGKPYMENSGTENIFYLPVFEGDLPNIAHVRQAYFLNDKIEMDKFPGYDGKHQLDDVIVISESNLLNRSGNSYPGGFDLDNDGSKDDYFKLECGYTRVMYQYRKMCPYGWLPNVLGNGMLPIIYCPVPDKGDYGAPGDHWSFRMDYYVGETKRAPEWFMTDPRDLEFVKPPTPEHPEPEIEWKRFGDKVWPIPVEDVTRAQLSYEARLQIDDPGLFIADFDGDGADDIFYIMNMVGTDLFEWQASYAADDFNGWEVLNGGYEYPNIARAPPELLRVGDFGTSETDPTPDGVADVFRVEDDYGRWRVSYGGVTDWIELNSNYTEIPVEDLRFGEFGRWYNDPNPDGLTDVFVQHEGCWWVSYGGYAGWTPLLCPNPTIPLEDLRFGDFGTAPDDPTADGVTDVFAQFDGYWYVSFGGVTDWHVLDDCGNCLTFEHLRFGDFGTSTSDPTADGVTDIFTQYDGCWMVSYSGRDKWHGLGCSDVPLEEVRFGDLDGDGRTELMTIGDLFPQTFLDIGQYDLTVRAFRATGPGKNKNPEISAIPTTLDSVQEDTPATYSDVPEGNHTLSIDPSPVKSRDGWYEFGYWEDLGPSGSDPQRDIDLQSDTELHAIFERIPR
jgi:hypothetical protein